MITSDAIFSGTVNPELINNFTAAANKSITPVGFGMHQNWLLALQDKHLCKKLELMKYY